MGLTARCVKRHTELQIHTKDSSEWDFLRGQLLYGSYKWVVQQKPFVLILPSFVASLRKEIGDLLVTVIFLRGGTPASLLKDPRALHRRASPRTESPWWGSMVRRVSIVEHGTVGSRSVPDFIVDIRAPRCIDMSRRCIDSCGDERVGTIIWQ